MSREDRQTEPGIDFFEFLYELWRAKWLFLGMVALCALVAALSILPRLLTPAKTAVVSAAQARIEFKVDVEADPLQRDAGSLIGNFLAHLTADKALGLSNAETANVGIPVTDRTYRVSYSPSAGAGVLTVTAADAEPGYFESVLAAMQKACAEQVTELKDDQTSDLQLIGQIMRDEYSGSSDSFAKRIFQARKFLARPDVQAGTFCLVTPVRLTNIGTLVEPIKRGVARRLILAILVGCIAGILAVMFRIAINRKARAVPAS